MEMQGPNLDQSAADSEEEDASLTSDCPFPPLEGTDDWHTNLLTVTITVWRGWKGQNNNMLPEDVTILPISNTIIGFGSNLFTCLLRLFIHGLLQGSVEAQTSLKASNKMFIEQWRAD